MGAVGSNLYLLKIAKHFNQASWCLKRKMDNLWVNSSLVDPHVLVYAGVTPLRAGPLTQPCAQLSVDSQLSLVARIRHPPPPVSALNHNPFAEPKKGNDGLLTDHWHLCECLAMDIFPGNS